MTSGPTLRPTAPVPAEMAATYVAIGRWDDRVLGDGIETAATERPDMLALVDNRLTLTWSELADRVSGGVTLLASHGVGSGHSVLLVGGNTAETVVAYHSLLRRGAVAVLLDRRCGIADVKAARESTAPSVAIVAGTERERLSPGLAGMSCLPAEKFLEPGAGTPEGWTEPDRCSPAVVLFTSGTTSRPKGVMHSVNTLTAGAANMAAITAADDQAIIFLVSPAASITGVMQMHLSADCHACLVLEDHFDGEASLRRVNECGATLLGGAPVIVERLVKAADEGNHPLALRTLALGGTMLPRPLLERVIEGYGIQVARVYGSSEAPNSTGSLPTDSEEQRLGDDGALTAGLEIKVGSSADQREGLLRGPNLFLGYIDDEDNAAAFEDGWYRTGDLVEVVDGRLTVVGRLQEIVNRNGLKVSLSEIDAALAGHLDLEESAAFGLPDPDTGERVAVAAVARPGSTLTLGSVVTYLLGQGLSTRKLPEQLVVWDEPLPRTASGKVIRARLVADAPAKPSFLAERLGG